MIEGLFVAMLGWFAHNLKDIDESVRPAVLDPLRRALRSGSINNLTQKMTLLYVEIFDRVFRVRTGVWRLPFVNLTRSALVSTIFCFLIMVLSPAFYTPILEGRTLEVPLAMLCVPVVNIVVDYVSVTQTRIIGSKLPNSGTFRYISFLIFDLFLTLVVAFCGALLASSVAHNFLYCTSEKISLGLPVCDDLVRTTTVGAFHSFWESLQTFFRYLEHGGISLKSIHTALEDRQLDYHHFGDPVYFDLAFFTCAFLTTAITSIWLWVYVLIAMLARLLRVVWVPVSRLSRYQNIDTHLGPFLSKLLWIIVFIGLLIYFLFGRLVSL